MQSQIFFIISSVGFIILWILASILLIYLIKVMRIIQRIVSKLEEDVYQLSDKTRDVFLDIQDSLVFRLFFKKRKRHKNLKRE